MLMKHQAFEQLVSEWLDRPAQDDLRASVEAALRADPALARLMSEWLHLNELIRRGLPGPDGVEWDRFKAHLAAQLERSPDESAHGDEAEGTAGPQAV
jgi:hypothetical protein